MNYNQATLYAATGKILMLPGCMDISIGTMVLKSWTLEMEIII